MGKTQERHQRIRLFKLLARIKSRHEQRQRIRKAKLSTSYKSRRERRVSCKRRFQLIEMKFNSLHEHLQFLVKKSLETQQKIGWGLIMDAILQRAETINPKTLPIVCPLLLDALRSSPCGTRETAMRISVTYGRYLKARFSLHVYDDVVKTDSYLNLCTLPEIPEFSGISQFVLRFCFHSKEFKPILNPIEFRDLATLALNSCEWKFMSVLLQYGFWNEEMYSLQVAHNDARDYVEGVMPVPEFHCEFVTANKTDFREFRQTCIYIVRRTGRNIKIIETMKDIWQGLRSNNGSMSCENSRGFRRIPLLIRMLRATTLDPQSQNTHKYLHCLRLYVSGLPDPLVSVDEVREFLLHLFKEASSGRRVIDTYVNKYAEIFGHHPYEPRSLAHLCRLAVRSTLAKKEFPTLPRLVEGLEMIPGTLKEFLLGAPEPSLLSWGEKFVQ